jgi:hypothetical protein
LAQLLQEVDLDLLDFQQAAPLMNHLMIQLVMQLPQFQFGVQIDQIVVLRPFELRRGFFAISGLVHATLQSGFQPLAGAMAGLRLISWNVNKQNKKGFTQFRGRRWCPLGKHIRDVGRTHGAAMTGPGRHVSPVQYMTV